MCEDDGKIRLGIGNFHGGEYWDCGCLGYDTLQFRRGRHGIRLHRNIGNYLLNCAVCLKMLVTGIGDECVNVLKLRHPRQWRTQEFCSRGGSTNSVEDKENGDLGGGSPLVRGSGGSCNLVQEISLHMVKFS